MTSMVPISAPNLKNSLVFQSFSAILRSLVRPIECKRALRLICASTSAYGCKKKVPQASRSRRSGVRVPLLHELFKVGSASMTAFMAIVALTTSPCLKSSKV